MGILAEWFAIKSSLTRAINPLLCRFKAKRTNTSVAYFLPPAFLFVLFPIISLAGIVAIKTRTTATHFPFVRATSTDCAGTKNVFVCNQSVLEMSLCSFLCVSFCRNFWFKKAKVDCLCFFSRTIYQRLVQQVRISFMQNAFQDFLTLLWRPQIGFDKITDSLFVCLHDWKEKLIFEVSKIKQSAESAQPNFCRLKKLVLVCSLDLHLTLHFCKKE